MDDLYPLSLISKEMAKEFEEAMDQPGVVIPVEGEGEIKPPEWLTWEGFQQWKREQKLRYKIKWFIINLLTCIKICLKRKIHRG